MRLIFSEPDGRRFQVDKKLDGCVVTFSDQNGPIAGLHEIDIDPDDAWRPQTIATAAGLLEIGVDENEVKLQLNGALFGRVNKHLWKMGFELACKD